MQKKRILDSPLFEKDNKSAFLVLFIFTMNIIGSKYRYDMTWVKCGENMPLGGAQT